MPNQPFLSDWVRETSTVEGTGDITLLGPVATFRSFASLYAVGDQFYYTIKHRSALEAESGIGQLTASSTIARSSILESTNANSAVAFSAGTKDVFIAPISKMFPTLGYNEIWQGNPGGPPIATSEPSLDSLSVSNVIGCGQLQLQDGSASVPSLSFGTNPDTGIYYLPVAGGSFRFVFDANPLIVVSPTGTNFTTAVSIVNQDPSLRALAINAAPGQTVPIVEYRDGIGTVLSYIGPTGNVFIAAQGITTKPLVVKGVAGITANLTEWQDSTGAVLVKITALASVVLANTALGVSATDGFTYLPSCVGKPVGTPTTQTGTVPIVVDTTGKQNFIYSGGEWVCVGPTVNSVTFGLAIGTPITTGTNKTNEITLPFAGRILRARARAKTGPTGADLIFDLNINGTTIWSTQANRLKILAGATTGSQTTFNTTTFADGDVLTIDVDQVGSTVAGQDITVQLEFRKTG